MTNRSEFRAALLAVAGALFAALAWGAQVNIGAPIAVKPAKAPRPHVLTFKGEVLHLDANQIIVRRRDDQRFIRTFTYSPKVKQQMEKLLDRGGYQYGDRVEIRYDAGSDVAIAIKGKPTKPL